MEVTLNGENSSDPEGAPLSFEWSQSSGPTDIVLLNANGGKPRFAAVVAGVYVFELKVHDGVQYSSPDYTEVNVIAGSDDGCGCRTSSGFGSLLIGLAMAGLLLRPRRRENP